MVKVNIKEKFELFDEHWTPKILGEVNNSYVKIFKAKGESTWHRNDHEDELFLVIRGKFTVKLRDQEDVVLEEGEFFIVPKGVEHCPVAGEEAHVLHFAPNTLEVDDPLNAKDEKWLVD